MGEVWPEAREHCGICNMRHSLCPGCGLPIAYNRRIHRMYDAHDTSVHYCANHEHSYEWARQQVREGFLALREPMVVEEREPEPVQAEALVVAPVKKERTTPTPKGVEVPTL